MSLSNCIPLLALRVDCFPGFSVDQFLDNISINNMLFSLSCLSTLYKYTVCIFLTCFFLFFPKDFTFPFSPQPPLIHSCIFQLWVLLVVACGMPSKHGLMSSAMSAPRILTGKTLGHRSGVTNLTTQPRGRPLTCFFHSTFYYCNSSTSSLQLVHVFSFLVCPPLNGYTIYYSIFIHSVFDGQSNCFCFLLL